MKHLILLVCSVVTSQGALTTGDWFFDQGKFDTSILTNVIGFAPATNGNLGGYVHTNGGVDTKTFGATANFTNGIAFAKTATLVALTNVVYTNVTLDFPSTATLTFSDLLVNVGNLKSNDICTVNVPGSSQTNGAFTSWISNTVLYVRYHNYQASAINPASGIFNIQVFQWSK